MTQNNKKTNVYVSPAELYSISYPTDWEYEEDETCTSFYKSDGVGALQISAYDTDNHYSAEESLTEYLKDKEIEDKTGVSQYEFQGNEVSLCSYNQENDFFKVWFITKNNIVVLATYNCEIRSKSVENKEVDDLVKTLKILV